MNRKPLTSSTVAAALCALGAAACAQTTIDHNKALKGGITPGDAPGYPITLSQPGHYRLTSQLVVPPGLDGVEITTDDVTLDLNGYTVRGPAKCVRDGGSGLVSCSGAIDNVGVNAGSFEATVRNGVLRGFSTGLLLRSGAVEKVTATHNSVYGMALIGESQSVRGSDLTATLNGEDGIKVWRGTLDNVASHFNGGYGVLGNTGNPQFSVVSRAHTTSNRLTGFGYVTVHGTVANGNLAGNTFSVKSMGNNVSGTTTY